MTRLTYALVTLLFSTSVSAQGEPVRTARTRPTPYPGNLYSRRAYIDSIYAAENFPPGTAAGVSAAEMAEYSVLVTQKRAEDGAATDWRRQRMIELFGRMNRAQQLQQRYVFTRPQPPLKARTLSDEKWEELSDESRYRLFIDNEPVTGHKLDCYSAADFAAWEVSDFEIKLADDQPFTRRVSLFTHSSYARMKQRYEASKDQYDQLVVRGGQTTLVK